MTAPGEPRRKFPLALDRVAAAAARPRDVLRPQRAHEDGAAAHVEARRHGAPQGNGLDSADVRRRMVQRLAAGGIGDARILAAFAVVPRHTFVDAGLATQAYEDTSLPIGHGQTISKPSVIARMLELAIGGANALRDGNLGAVLEIGTGCGYQAAVVAELSRRVLSVERLKPLHEKARDRLAPMRADRIRLVWGDGMLGHPPGAPYDTIVSAAGGKDVPHAWLEQLAIGGRLVAPVELDAGRQALVVVDRTESGHTRRLYETVKFVPLKSGLAH